MPVVVFLVICDEMAHHSTCQSSNLLLTDDGFWFSSGDLIAGFAWGSAPCSLGVLEIAKVRILYYFLLWSMKTWMEWCNRNQPIIAFGISSKTNTWSITAARLTSLLSSIHSVIHTSIYPSIFSQHPLCLDTSPSSSRIIPRHSQDSRVMHSLPRVLLLTRGLLLAPYAWETSPGRLPGAIWYRCLTPSAGSCGSTPTTFQVIKLPTLSLR